MAQSAKKRLETPKPLKSRKTQVKFQKRMENNHKILSKFEL
jgi:hypothetical protein